MVVDEAHKIAFANMLHIFAYRLMVANSSSPVFMPYGLSSSLLTFFCHTPQFIYFFLFFFSPSA